MKIILTTSFALLSVNLESHMTCENLSMTDGIPLISISWKVPSFPVSFTRTRFFLCVKAVLLLGPYLRQ